MTIASLPHRQVVLDLQARRSLEGIEADAATNPLGNIPNPRDVTDPQAQDPTSVALQSV